MKIVLAACLGVFCAGCTTGGDVSKTQPIAVMLTSRPVSDVAACAEPVLRQVWTQVRSVPVRDGQRLTAESGGWGAVPATVDVYPSTGGSMVEVRLGPGKSNGIVRLLKPCLEPAA